MRNRPIAQMVLIGVIAVAIGIPVALVIPWFPANGADQSNNDRYVDVEAAGPLRRLGQG